MKNIITMSDVKESDRLKRDALHNTLESVKDLLTDEQVEKFKEAFYFGTEGYLFRRKAE